MRGGWAERRGANEVRGNMTARGSETGEKDLTSLHTLSQFANPKARHKARGSGWFGGW